MEFRELFFRSMEEMAKEIYSPERVEQAAAEWETVWEPLLPRLPDDSCDRTM